MEIINKILRSVDDFPTLPTIYSALSDIMENPRSTSADAANVIIRDQSSSAKILKTANSPIYGFNGKIDTISQAIFYIGFDEVRNLVVTLGVMDFFKQSKFSHALNPVDLWKHSIAVGVITRLLGKSLGIKNIENFFVSGVLHDIGKLLFLRYLPEDYEATFNYAAEKRISIKDAETETLGITHTIAGELIAEKWKLPSIIRNAIKYHHLGIIDNEVKTLPACIHIADITARMLEFGNAGDNLIPEPNFRIWKELDLLPETFTSIYNQIIIDYQTSMEIFHLN